MTAIVRAFLCVIAAADLQFAVFSLFGAPKTPSAPSHWYSIAKVPFFQDPYEADTYAQGLRKSLLPELKFCELADKEFKDLIAQRDPTREIIQLRAKTEGSRDIDVIVTLRADESSKNFDPILCGNTPAEECAKMFQRDIARSLIEHDKNCHRGKPCADHQ